MARCENVVAKLGGLNMPFNGFGIDRRMFESNLPVDKVSCGYNVL
jgi:hypothetical protein